MPSSTHDPMDVVIGAESRTRDARAAAGHVEAAKKLEGAGNRPGAVAEYRRAISADPMDSRIFFQLAYLLDLAGEEDEAIAMYERSIDTPPAPINALINLAILHEDRGDYVRAERCLRQVLDTNPNHPRAKLYMKDVQASREMVIDDDGDRDRTKRSAMMDTPVTDFELTVRARTCLKKMNIRTLGDLLRTTEAELLGYKNFGESSLVEIKHMLAGKGLKLGQGAEDAHRQAQRRIMEGLKGTGGEQMLGKPVSDMNLSVRARKALQLLNINSIGELVSHTEAELMGVKNFGATSLSEVKQKLVEYGLDLRKLDL